MLRMVYVIKASPELQEFPNASFSDFFRNQVMTNVDSR